MRYKIYIKECCKFYIIFTIACIVYWLYRNGDIIGKQIDAEILPILVGLNNGYSYQWILATIILLGYLFIVNKGLNFDSVAHVIRKSRDNIVNKNLIRTIVNAICYVTIYMVVDVIFIVLVSDISLLLQMNFFVGMLLFSVSLSVVYAMMGILYTMIYLCTDNSYLALIIVFVVNILIVFSESYMCIDVFGIYTNLSVLDNIICARGISVLKWFIKVAIQILLAYGFSIIVKEKYYRRDIMNRNVKK